MGIPKAAVLPVPVCAWPITSSPARHRGIVSLCMGDGSSNPISVNAATIFLSKSKSPKSSFVLFVIVPPILIHLICLSPKKKRP